MIFAEVCLTFCPRSLNYYQLLGTNPPTPIVDLQCVSILKENTWLSWTRVGQLIRLLDKADLTRINVQKQKFKHKIKTQLSNPYSNVDMKNYKASLVQQLNNCPNSPSPSTDL